MQTCRAGGRCCSTMKVGGQALDAVDMKEINGRLSVDSWTPLPLWVGQCDAPVARCSRVVVLLKHRLLSALCACVAVRSARQSG